MYKNAIENITSGNIIEGMDDIAELFNEKTYYIELLNLLEETFVTPNKENMSIIYEKNVELLVNYPYIFNKNFKKHEENTLKLFPVDGNIFYEYNKNYFKFEKIEVNSTMETKYFFEFLDKPLLIVNEFNEFNLNFLVDNVRASEDVAYENHIYLYYDNIEVFTKLLYYCDFQPLLKDKKLVFLFDDDKTMYPIDFKQKFDIDYESMEFKEVRIDEIKRIVLQNHLFANSGNDLFVESFDGHPNLLNFAQYDTGFASYNKDITLKQYIQIIDKAISTNKFETIPILINGFRITQINPFHIKANFIAFFNIFKRVCKKNNATSKKDWMCCNYIAFSIYSGIKAKERITPTIHHIVHSTLGHKKSLESSDIYDDLLEVFQEFKYFTSYAHIRDPLISMRGFLKYFVVIPNQKDPFGKNIFDFSLLKHRLVNIDFLSNTRNLHNHKFENKVFIRFEDMKLNPKATLLSICRWLNIPYNDILLTCTLMEKPIYLSESSGENIECKIKSGFSVYPLYPRDILRNVFSKENIEVLEKILMPSYSYFGYKPMSYKCDIKNKLNQKDIGKILKNKFAFERFIYQNLNLNQEVMVNGKPILINQLIHLYRNEFYKEAIAYQNNTIDIINTNQVNLYPVLKPIESECVNPIYENMLSLPELPDINVDFIGKAVDNKQGKLYWITGLSGSGKTTIGMVLKEELEKTSEKVIFLDGDRLRELISYDVGYSESERKRNSYRYAGFCKLLQEQGFTVICCTISLFHELHQWNRENIPNYFEVFVNVSDETLISRNQKDLYSNDTKNLFGKDIKAEFPINPDVEIKNDQCTIEEAVKLILSK